MKRIRTTNHSISYDGTFDGFLTYVYFQYKEKYNTMSIDPAANYKPDMSSEKIDIITNEDHALRVLKGIITKSNERAAKEIYALFLSHEKGIEMKIFDKIKSILSYKSSDQFAYPAKSYLSGLYHKIIREVERQLPLITFLKMR